MFVQKHGQKACPLERIGAHGSRCFPTFRKECLQPRQSFTRVVAQLPELRARGCKTKTNLNSSWLTPAPRERRAQVVMLSFQTLCRCDLLGTPQLTSAFLRQRQEIFGVLSPDS